MITSTTRVYTAAEVATILHVDRETVYRWARADKIGYCPKLPGQRYYRFSQKHIDDYLKGIAPVSPKATKAPKSSRHPKYALSK